MKKLFNSCLRTGYRKNVLKTGILFYLLVFIWVSGQTGCSNSARIRAGYLLYSTQQMAEDSAAFKWLSSLPRVQASQVLPGEGVENLSKFNVLWVHIPDSRQWERWQLSIGELKILGEYVKQGGHLLLTDYAALLPAEIGLEKNKPEIKILDIKDDWLFDKKGFQSFRGHPVFTGLFGGAFVWDSYRDQKLPTIGYFDANFPADGKVVATEKSYITIHGNNKLMIEHTAGTGKALSIGGFVYFAQRNRLQYKLEKFLDNSIRYLAGELTSGKKTYWNKYDHQPKSFQVKSEPAEPPQTRGLKISPEPDLVLSRDHPRNNYYDISGRRALIMGKENGGIDEFWVHPFRVLRDFQAGIIVGNSIHWLKDMPVKVEVYPEVYKRVYATSVGELEELILPSLGKAGGIVHYQAKSGKPVSLVVKFRSDLRWMWPYDEYAVGDVWYAFDEGLNALHLKDSAGDLYSVIGADQLPEKYTVGQYRDIRWNKGAFSGLPCNLNQAFFAGEYELNKTNGFGIYFAIVGTNLGESEALAHYRQILANPQAVYDEAHRHYKKLLTSSVTVESPNNEFSKLWKWAIIGTDRFLAYTPTVGTGLLAGFSTTERGWNGRHKISGRPGYAWYFGRDSEWSGFAIDNYGDFETVKKQLEFLQKYQDLSGKIFHEISTSGVVHYDAADATPLYIILAAHYLRASGDVEFIQQSWSHIKKALDFLYTTDTDGDHLIENTNVGHGWVEGGKLWGAHTTLYLAALWAQTLSDAAYLAGFAGKNELVARYRKDAKVVKEIINRDFWNEQEHFYNYGKFADGTYNTVQTDLPAVAMYFELTDDRKVGQMLAEYAGNGFSPDWGVRILSSASPLFKPSGYHYGSVWPLFTGWTALAEYAYGNSTQAFSHFSSTMRIKKFWNLGYVEEVMHGMEYKPSGVCSHQCWSETNILHPGIHGMIGWQPDAPAKTAILSPRFPLNWDSVQVNNLRVGGSLVMFRMKREMNTTHFKFRLETGPAITITFAPELPAGMIVDSVLVNGKKQNIRNGTFRGVLKDTIKFLLRGKSEIVFRHRKGVGMFPVIPQPKPGDYSVGNRIVAARLDGQKYRVRLQGQSGTNQVFKMRIFDQSVKQIEGAEIVAAQDGVVSFRVRFPKSKDRFIEKLITIEMQ